MQHPKLAVLALVSALTAGWSGYLVHVHREAVQHGLEPGVLCGPEGGCGAVLASPWSAIAGVPVSAPGIFLFGGIAVAALAAATGRADTRRVSALAAGGAAIAAAFGAFLLYIMLGEVGEVCRYCLVLDTLVLGSLAAALAAHPESPGAALREAAQAPARLLTDGVERGVIAVTLLGTLAFPMILPEPVEQEPAAIEVVMAPPTSEVAPAAPAVEASRSTRRVVIPAEVHEIAVGPDVPTKGPANAKVTIAVFEDFQCPFCAKLAGTLEALLAQRTDTRVAWFHFPMHTACNETGLTKDMHPGACGGAAASVCAHAQGQFWPMHDRLFKNNAHLDDDDLKRHAEAVGLDLAAFDACMASPATLAKVKADAKIGGDRGVNGTPTFFINGRMFSGGQPVAAINAAIDAILAQPTERVTLDVDVQDEIIGDVANAKPEVRVDIEGLSFDIFAFEASLDAEGRAVSRPGVAPATNLTWHQAKAACEKAGRRLCTEEEWLTACTGARPKDEDRDRTLSDDMIRGRAHPYGNFKQDENCTFQRGPDAKPPLITGNHPRCVTPEGVYDLEGLTKEWIGLSPDRAALKGGSFLSMQSGRCGYLKDNEPLTLADETTGFRCCGGREVQVRDHHPGGKVGDKLMDFKLPLLGGGEFDSASLAGKPLVLTFWASWCGPCRKEMPALNELYAQYKAQGFTVIGVNTDKTPAQAKAFLQGTPVDFPILLDPDGAMMSKFDAYSLPTAFWIGADGVIVQRTIGYDERERPVLDKRVSGLLGGK